MFLRPGPITDELDRRIRTVRNLNNVSRALLSLLGKNMTVILAVYTCCVSMGTGECLASTGCEWNAMELIVPDVRLSGPSAGTVLHLKLNSYMYM